MLSLLLSDEENDEVVKNLDGGVVDSTTDPNAVESAAFPDPCGEFESSMPGVVEVEQNERINEASTEDAVIEQSKQSGDLNNATGFASQRDEGYGNKAVPDVLPSDPEFGDQELVPHSSGQAIDTSEGNYNEKDEGNIQQSHFDSKVEGPETQSTSHHVNEAEFAQVEEPEDETQVEDGTLQEEGMWQLLSQKPNGKSDDSILMKK